MQGDVRTHVISLRTLKRHNLVFLEGLTLNSILLTPMLTTSLTSIHTHLIPHYQLSHIERLSRATRTQLKHTFDFNLRKLSIHL